MITQGGHPDQFVLCNSFLSSAVATNGVEVMVSVASDGVSVTTRV
jgi:hypothetical protein